jgi:NADPH:quinone reductase-like Zn-dependent oxidoreductase
MDMKAFVVDRYGKNVRLRAGDVPEPELGLDEVLVEVYATSVNPLDFKIRNGDFKLFMSVRPPFVLGHDVAGVVVRVGAAVKSFKIGDEVYASPDDFQVGTFAQYVPVKASSVAIKPQNISMEEAASLPLVALTAWQILVERAKVKAGQKVFIQAGSGGVGTIAIQLAKHLGAVVATTTSTANVEWVKSLGADVVVDYKQTNFEEVLSGYDVVLNSQDGATLYKAFNILKSGGQVVSISGPPDAGFAEALKLAWPFKQLMRLLSFGARRKANHRNATYSFLFMRASGEQLRQVAALVESGAIRPVVDKVFPFASTNEAMAYVESGRAKGKVVIQIKSAS